MPNKIIRKEKTGKRKMEHSFEFVSQCRGMSHRGKIQIKKNKNKKLKKKNVHAHTQTKIEVN